MSNFIYKILILCTIIVLSLPMFQMGTNYYDLRPLKGAVVSAEEPSFSFRSYVDGSYQNGLENYLKDNFGFREWLIRLYNQYLFTFFHKTNNVSILFGKDNWLFESDFVKDHYESLMYDYASDSCEMAAIFEKEALRLWKVQELLKEYDIHIFVNIIPGKDVIFPEYLPKNTSYFRPEGLHAYDYYTKRFDELGVNYIDNVKIFKDLKGKTDYQLFTKNGTHWSNIASIYVFDSIINYMERIGNRNITNIKIGEKYKDIAREPDDDLEQLLNLTFRMRSEKNLYADVEAITDSTAEKPYFVVIGDSYVWNFFFNIPMKDIFWKVPYWYYNSTIYYDPEYSSTAELDFEKELMRTNYFMLNYCTVQLYKLGNNFIGKALTYLCYDQQTIDSVAHHMMDAIRSNQDWYDNIVAQAQKDNKNVNEELYKNALYVIFLEPEKYFEDLNGDKLPVARNKNFKAIKEKKEEMIYNAKLQDLKNYMYTDENWMNTIRKKAKQNGISVEEQMDLDARWALENP